MAGRVAWILAGGVAVIGGLIYHDRAKIQIGDRDGHHVVYESKGDRDDHLDPATTKALAAAVARQVRAEVRLETMDAVGDPSKKELAAAKAEVARAEAEVERLEGQIKAQRDNAEREVAGEETLDETGKDAR